LSLVLDYSAKLGHRRDHAMVLLFLLT